MSMSDPLERPPRHSPLALRFHAWLVGQLAATRTSVARLSRQTGIQSETLLRIVRGDGPFEPRVGIVVDCLRYFGASLVDVADMLDLPIADGTPRPPDSRQLMSATDAAALVRRIAERGPAGVVVVVIAPEGSSFAQDGAAERPAVEEGSRDGTTSPGRERSPAAAGHAERGPGP